MNKPFFEMQQDAINRVKEMQKRAKETVGETPNNEKNHQPQIPQRKSIINLFDFKKFQGSQEDFLILSLIVLLADEGADMMLVLALLYLIM